MPLKTVIPSSPGAIASRRIRHRMVVYRDAYGSTWDAKLLGTGTSSGVKLLLVSGLVGTSRSGMIIDNVPLATSMKSTGAYFNRF